MIIDKYNKAYPILFKLSELRILHEALRFFIEQKGDDKEKTKQELSNDILIFLENNA